MLGIGQNREVLADSHLFDLPCLGQIARAAAKGGHAADPCGPQTAAGGGVTAAKNRTIFRSPPRLRAYGNSPGLQQGTPAFSAAEAATVDSFGEIVFAHRVGKGIEILERPAERALGSADHVLFDSIAGGPAQAAGVWRK